MTCPCLARQYLAGKTTLGQWHRAAQQIGTHLQPNRLNLSFTCDCADLATAKQAVETLLEQLPPLAACSIRLCRHRDAELLSLSEHAALRAIGRGHAPRPSELFRFMELPTELRLAILSRTDLVAPMREVCWDSDHGYHFQQRFCPCRAERVPPPQQLDISLFDAEDHAWLISLERHWACNFMDCVRYYKRGCFCQRYHSACTTTYPACSCWKPPTSLFLVSHAFRRD